MIDSTISTSCVFTETLTPNTLATYMSSATMSAHTHHAHVESHVTVEERLRPEAADDRDAGTGKGDRGEVVDAGREHRGALAERMGDELVDRARPAVSLGELAQRPADAEYTDGRRQDHERADSAAPRTRMTITQHTTGEDRPDRQATARHSRRC